MFLFDSGSHHYLFVKVITQLSPDSALLCFMVSFSYFVFTPSPLMISVFSSNYYKQTSFKTLSTLLTNHHTKIRQ